MEPFHRLSSRPSPTLGSVHLLDIEGDGRLEAVVWKRPLGGIVERSIHGDFVLFERFKGLPTTTNLDDPRARRVDLDGDGVADLLIADGNLMRWHPSRRRWGYGKQHLVRHPPGEEDGPRVLFHKGGESVFLADMTGDGLADIVRVRNREVCYWPNRGYGRFGGKVLLRGSPRFDAPDRFDPRRIRLADIDGTGVADVIYLGPDAVRLWRNQAGNSLGPEQVIHSLPGVEHPNTITVTDLLGDGTACLVWTSPLPGAGSHPIRYLRLMAEGKPYLLTGVDNGLGRKTTLSYTPSTWFYAQDRRAGTPWATPLPFPVHCLSRVEQHDGVTGWRHVSTCRYKHGTLDPTEREFRGFALVEQRDAESVTDFDDDDALAHHLPPVLTKTWFHTGSWEARGHLEKVLRASFWAGDAEAPTFPARAAMSGVPRDHGREAVRALKGTPLRVEVYAEDDTPEAAHPYTVTETGYAVRLVQPRAGQKHAVFHTVPVRTRTAHYERQPADPRVAEELVLTTDAYGRPTLSASVAYPRRTPAVPAATEQGQGHLLLSAQSRIDHDDPTSATYHLGLPSSETTWALTGIEADDTAPLEATALLASFEGAATIAFETPPTGGTTVEKRTLSRTRTLWFKDDLTGPEPLGEAGVRALVYRTEEQVFTAGLVGASGPWGTGRVSVPSDLEEAGYVLDATDDSWWRVSGTMEPDAAKFYQPVRYVDPWDNATEVGYDPSTLFVTLVEDPMGNETTAAIDYRALAPWQLVDPNGTRREVAFDALGRVVALAVTDPDDEGDTLEAPTATFSYEPYRWRELGEPARTVASHREVHGDPESRWQTQTVYSDGGGEVVMTKVQAAPGLAPKRDAHGELVFDGGELVFEAADPRWIGTGRTVLNNKGLPVKQYEPFFSSTDSYETEADLVEWGVTPVMTYDPLGRQVRVDLPDGAVESVAFSPWFAESYDAEDTRIGGDHEDTPAVQHLDSLGRVVVTVETPDGTAEHLTRVVLDVLGNLVEVIDPRENSIQVQRFDMVGRPMFTGAADEGYDGVSGDGESYVLLDAADQTTRTWRSGGLKLRQSMDALRRPVGLWVDEGSGERLVERTFYGEALSDAPEHSRGQPVRVYDTAGEVQLAYDFRGRVTEQSRTVIEDITVEADWAGLDSEESLADLDTWVEANAGLDDETFTVTTAYDALDRPTEQTAPDDSRTVPTYDEGGRLSAVEVFVRGAGTATSFVEQITTNARGQREKIVYGNHTETAYTYDEDRLWLTRLRTDRSSSSTHGAAKLQDLSFERDLVGNLTQIDDDAQETVFFSNAQVSPERDFVYDSLYRLVSATGREKTGQGQSTAFYQDYAGGPGGIPDAGDPALRRYTQSYVYDAAGNILETKHQQGTFGSVLWRRGYGIEAENNQLVSTSLPGDDPEDPGTHSQSYAYNARGAMVFMPHLKPGVSANLVRDFRDQIRKAELDSAGSVAWYSYDASGERVRKVWDKSGGLEERIYVGGYEVWRQRDGSGDVEEERQTLHVMDDEQRIAMVETLTVTGGSDVGSPTPRVGYQLGDHLGTALLEVDGDGGVISYEEYHPYGTTAWWAETSAIEVSTKRYRYTGKERDEETGLQYHSARYYAPWLGRWERADPIGLGDGVNRFEYVAGSPPGASDTGGMRSPNTPPRPTSLPDDKGAPELPDSQHDAGASSAANGGSADQASDSSFPVSPHHSIELIGEYENLKAIIRGDALPEPVFDSHPRAVFQ